MLTTLKRLIPLTLRIKLRTRYDRSRKSLSRILRPSDPLMPPDELMFVGGDRTNFKQMGEKWRQTLIQFGGLQPHHSVLDAGCGVGRIAIGLTGYLTPPGLYDGFDTVPEGIEWCQRQITPRFPHFRFQHADVYNEHYNPRGRFTASEYKFPYADDSFDFVFLTSVFTHMLPPDLKNYLGEVSRVLRPGGRCLITYFILNEYSRQRLEAGLVEPESAFKHDLGGCYVLTMSAPEAAVAYAEDDLRRFYEEVGLEVEEPIPYGAWSGRADARHHQDLIVARKR